MTPDPSQAEPNPPSVLLSEPLLREIEAQAERDYPAETCGYLLGKRRDNAYQIERLFPAANAHSGDRLRNYQIVPKDYRAAEELCRELGLENLGIYHSHPDSEPIPSSVDAELAFPGWIYWIIRVEAAAVGEARAWLRDFASDRWIELASPNSCEPS